MHAKFLFFSGQIIVIRASLNKRRPRELVSCEALPITVVIRHVVSSVPKYDICCAISLLVVAVLTASSSVLATQNIHISSLECVKSREVVLVLFKNTVG